MTSAFKVGAFSMPQNVPLNRAEPHGNKFLALKTKNRSGVGIDVEQKIILDKATKK